jgi:hypothetical protein
LIIIPKHRKTVVSRFLIVLEGEEYWRKAFDVDFLVSEGVIDLEGRDLFWYAETA